MAKSYKRLGYTGSGSSGGSSFVKDPVATLPSLPALGNTTGDLRYVNSVDQWYQWNGGSWESWTTFLTADMVLVTDSNSFPISSGVSATELSYLTGVSANVQEQIDNLSSFASLFNDSSDWLGPTLGEYRITIPASVHNKSEPIVEVFEQNGSEFNLVFINVSVDLASSDVTITVSETPDLRFAGKITIS